MNHKEEREKDVNTIKDSKHPRKVIVAGPGTGKSFLFQELIKTKRLEGKTDFVAITFIGKLGDALADDLCGLATTMTMHGFARKLFLSIVSNYTYYPDIYTIIEEDLKKEGITNFKIGDANYKKKTHYYKAVGNADVVHYVTEICKQKPNKIPKHDLILIDEFQDFNEVESQFVDLLATKNEIVIVGDDDQALYEFKGSSPDYIRDKHNAGNLDFESHTLRFCSRCTEVMIKYFHDIVKTYNLNGPGNKRVQKEYLCYLPDKAKDSAANQKIHLIKGCPVGMIATKVKTELSKVVIDQKIKDVLIIGEGKTCRAILGGLAKQLTNYGFKNVDYRDEDTVKKDTVEAYKMIHKDEKSLLGWRILGNPGSKNDIDTCTKNAKTLNTILNDVPSKIKNIADSSMKALQNAIEIAPISEADLRKNILVKDLKTRYSGLPRPLENLNITVCNTLNSKGLGADVVFVVGFDQGKFPAKSTPEQSEIYQMLVALTRAKKRIYFINTVDKPVSNFIKALDKKDLDMKEVPKPQSKP